MAIGQAKISCGGQGTPQRGGVKSGKGLRVARVGPGDT